MTTGAPPRRRIAVIGGGVSGLTAAYLLREVHDVVLYEAEPRLGGHAHTHTVTSPNGDVAQVDSGFIVHNHRTYPNMLRLFDELDVETQTCEMSMSIRCDGCGLEFAGGRGAGGLLANPKRLLDPRFPRMLLGVKRFHRRASAFLARTAEDDDTTFGTWLRDEGFDDYLVEHYAVPLVACVWSSGHGIALDYPARYLFTFLDHHGMLTVTGSPQWYTVTGGSARYVEKIAAALPDVRVGEPVVAVTRSPRVTVTTASGTEEYDHVLLATHADTALALLDDADDREREILGAFDYTTNRTLLHRDDSVLPTTKRARAAWNYRMPTCAADDEAPTVTYWMNRLHELPEDAPYLVTLNDIDGINAADRIAEMTYTHPLFTLESVDASRRIGEITTESTSFAGAHLGWGFHEDGCRSGVDAARALGATW